MQLAWSIFAHLYFLLLLTVVQSRWSTFFQLNLKKKASIFYYFLLLLIVNLAPSTFLQQNVFVVGTGTVSIINISPPRLFCCCQWCSWNGPHFPSWTFLLLVMVQVASSLFVVGDLVLTVVYLLPIALSTAAFISELNKIHQFTIERLFTSSKHMRTHTLTEIPGPSLRQHYAGQMLDQLFLIDGSGFKPRVSGNCLLLIKCMFGFEKTAVH